MKNFKKNQVVIFVAALMLITAGYLNFSNESKNLVPTSSLADSEHIASIGDATLVNANEVVDNSNTNSQLEDDTSKNNEQSAQTNSEDEYFTQSRLDRDTMYSQMLENYQKMLETANLSNEEKELAQTEIKRINNEKNAIMIAENLIKTKEFEDVVIFINNGNVSVIVKTEKLEENQIAQIQNILTRELNVKVNKINVSNKK